VSLQPGPRSYSLEGRHLSLLQGDGRLSEPHRGGRMLTWLAAHQVANMAAAKAHAALAVNLSEVQVNVVDAIRASGAQLMWQPIPRIFGAYVNEVDSRPGILINSALPHAARRYTAAHELGHHVLSHTTTVDDGSTIDTVLREELYAMPGAARRRAWPDQEKLAEAFAAWFLMPRRVVGSALSVLGLSRPRSDLDVYRLSLLLGTSYRTTVRHLPNIKLAHGSNSASWARTGPARLKAQLDAGFSPPASRSTDVWLLEPSFNGLQIQLQSGDRVAFRSVLPSGTAIPDWLRPVEPATGVGVGPGRAMFEVGPSQLSAFPASAVLDCESWAVTLQLAEAPRGLDPRGPA